MGGSRGRESKQLNLSISGNPITIFYPSATLLSTRDSLRIKGGVASVADSGASSQITAIQFAYIHPHSCSKSSAKANATFDLNSLIAKKNLGGILSR